MQLKDLLPGSHRVRQRRKDGTACEYWYAWRGGPQILKLGPLPIRALEQAILTAAPAALATFKAKTTTSDEVTLYGLITRYLASSPDEPEKPPVHLRHMAPRTLKDRRTHLDFVRKEIGHMELRALEARGARKVLLDWRDSMAATPKSADERLYATSCVLDWATDRGELSTNPVKEFDRIYSVDRSEIIWEPHHQEILFRHADPEFAEFARVNMLSGIRMGDLRRLLRTAPGPNAIMFQTGKSNRKRTVVAPIFDELRAVLDRIQPSPKSATLLNSSRGTPWSEAGLESAIQRAKARALKAARERGGPDAKSGIEHLRIHDMRGTAATNFMRWGLDDDAIAIILGWKKDRVAEIRRRYVSGQEIGLALIRRIHANKAGREV